MAVTSTEGWTLKLFHQEDNTNIIRIMLHSPTYCTALSHGIGSVNVYNTTVTLSFTENIFNTKNTTTAIKY